MFPIYEGKVYEFGITVNCTCVGTQTRDGGELFSGTLPVCWLLVVHTASIEYAGQVPGNEAFGLR